MDGEDEHFWSLSGEFADKVSGGRPPLSWAVKGSGHVCLHSLGSTGVQEGKAAYSGSPACVCHLSFHPDGSQQAFPVFLGERE